MLTARRRTVAKRKGPNSELPPDSFAGKLHRLLETHRAGRSDVEIAARADMAFQAFSRIRLGIVEDVTVKTADKILKAIDATWTDYDRA